MARKLYGNTVTIGSAKQEIITPSNVGLDQSLPNLVYSVKDFQILNEGTSTIRVQINGGKIVPIMAGMGIDMGDDWVDSCIVHTASAKVTWMCKR